MQQRFSRYNETMLKRILLHFCLLCFICIKAEIYSQDLHTGILKPSQIDKVSLTQKGYIQFLRYLTDIPPIDDFTFCIWLKSSNLTYSHPLLSYSHEEKDRFIRAWVTPKGEYVNLYIREKPVFSVKVSLAEHKWYHICPSWSSKTGHWDLYMNGRLKAHGQSELARGIVLPKHGDLVVGQEYTDFDKGLDDGIEGDIFGFNMVLSSTVSKKIIPSKAAYSFNRRTSTRRRMDKGYLVSSPSIIIRRRGRNLENEEGNLGTNPQNITTEDSKRTKRQSFGYSTPLFPNYGASDDIYTYKTIQPAFMHRAFTYPLRNQYVPNYMVPPKKQSRTSNDILGPSSHKSLGLQLVELSFNCVLGKGAPLKNVLISWTKTPVRVFGGAILKKVDPFCL